MMVSRPLPISCAPMAGGPSTPALAKAVSQAGGLGFLAGGTITPAQLQADLAEMQGSIYAVNLFAKQHTAPTAENLAALRALVEDLYAQYDQVPPPWPQVDLTNGWDEKLAAILAAPTRPVAVSSTFGCFSETEIERLHAAGIAAWVSVTNPDDALTAYRVGADALVVQGPEAGGHRATWDIAAEPDSRPLAELVKVIAANVPQLALIAAGGITTADDVRQALSWPGVQAVSIGTAFLLAEEAGTSSANREILHSHQREGSDVTVATRAFSGRVARGVKTEFTANNPHLPPLYPYVNALLKPLRETLARSADTRVSYCLAGIKAGEINQASAAEILASLTPPELTANAPARS